MFDVPAIRLGPLHPLGHASSVCHVLAVLRVPCLDSGNFTGVPVVLHPQSGKRCKQGSRED